MTAGAQANRDRINADRSDRTSRGTNRIDNGFGGRSTREELGDFIEHTKEGQGKANAEFEERLARSQEALDKAFGYHTSLHNKQRG